MRLRRFVCGCFRCLSRADHDQTAGLARRKAEPSKPGDEVVFVSEYAERTLRPQQPKCILPSGGMFARDLKIHGSISPSVPSFTRELD